MSRPMLKLRQEVGASSLERPARGDVAAGPGRLCVMAGIDAVKTMMNEDAADLAGECCRRDAGRPGHRRGGHPA